MDAGRSSARSGDEVGHQDSARTRQQHTACHSKAQPMRLWTCMLRADSRPNPSVVNATGSVMERPQARHTSCGRQAQVRHSLQQQPTPLPPSTHQVPAQPRGWPSPRWSTQTPATCLQRAASSQPVPSRRQSTSCLTWVPLISTQHRWLLWELWQTASKPNPAAAHRDQHRALRAPCMATRPASCQNQKKLRTAMLPPTHRWQPRCARRSSRRRTCLSGGQSASGAG